jgi:outer membrane protein W
VTRTGLVPLVLLLAFAPCRAAVAQSSGKFALGGEFTTRVPNDSTTVHSANGPDLLWRFGHGRTGWGWHWGLSWFSTDLDRTIGGHDIELGELRVRPFMAGYGYTRVIRRAKVTADVIAGYALTKMSLTPEAGDAYRNLLGARSVTADASNTLAAKPEVGAWFDVNKKIGINVSAGYVIARPHVTIRSSLGEDDRPVRADMFILRVGAVYSIF